MPIQSMTPFDSSQFFRLPSLGGTGTQRLDTQVGAIAVSNKLAGQLTVMTAEGDKVTLSANLAEDFRTVTYRGAAGQGSTSVEVNGQQAEYSLRKELGVTVEGDLSEQEVKDLSKLFRRVLNIFRKFFHGQEEAGLAKMARLADRFDNFSTLSNLDLSAEVERSVTVIAAQVASEVTGQAALPADRSGPSVIEAQSHTPSAAPSAEAAIPPPSTGTTAPTQPSADSVAARDTAVLHLATPVSEGNTPASLVDQVLDALKESDVEPRKLRRHLPRLLDKVREELQNELRGETERNQTIAIPVQTAGVAFLGYQSIRQASVTLSIHT
jgi:hypothetical protein